jgi:diguanylate cyclase (GGDEF)-like protein
LRTTIPERRVRDPALFVFSIDTAAIFFYGGERIYAFPEHNLGDDPPFSGWPWHLIPLPDRSGGEELTVRVYSDYRDIGLWGTVIFGNRADLHGHIARRDLLRFLSGTVLLAVGIVALLAFIFGPSRRNYLHLFFIVLLMTIWTISSSYSKQFIGGSPLLWQYLENTLPMAIFALIAELVHRFMESREGGVFRLFAYTYAVTGVLSLLLPLLGVVPLHAVHAPQDALFVLFWTTTVVSAIRYLRKGNRDGVILLATFALAGLAVAYSIPISYGLVPWTDDLAHIPLMVFAVGLSVMVGRRFAKVYGDLRNRTAELEHLNANLEGIVEERTEALEMTNLELRNEKEKLERLSSIDDLTGLYNRREFSDLMGKAMALAERRGDQLLFMILDVDHFKELNDTHGHLVGDIVLRSVASVLSQELRAGDFAGRFGGDEFVALLTGVTSDSVEPTIERIRLAIRNHDWFTEEYQVTISCGAALYESSRHGPDVERLLSDADSALYEAKRSGRDRSCLSRPGDEGLREEGAR